MSNHFSVQGVGTLQCICIFQQVSFLWSLFTDPFKAAHRHARAHNVRSGTTACRKGNEKWKRKTWRKRGQKGLNCLPDTASHVTPTCTHLSWVQVLEEILCLFRAGWGSQWHPTASEDHCWDLSYTEKTAGEKYPSGTGTANTGSLLSFRSQTILMFALKAHIGSVNNPLKADTCVVLRFSSSVSKCFCLCTRTL